MRAFQEYQKMPKAPRMSKFYKGGFDAKMNKREAALILGLRYVTWTSVKRNDDIDDVIQQRIPSNKEQGEGSTSKDYVVEPS